MARKSKGRQKIEMTRMSKESNLLVTFSKRRSGLFKKAYELTTLCGAEIAIIVFSPGKKVFSFGHPDVLPIIDRFQNSYNSPTVVPPLPRSNTTTQIVEAHRSASVRELNLQLEEMHDQLDMQKKHGDELAELRKASQGACWWEGPVNQLGLLELEQLKEAMEELKKNTAKQAEKLIIMEAAAAAAAAAASHPNNCFLGGGTTSSSSSSRGVGGGGGHVGTGFDPINVSPGLGLSMNPHGGNNLGGYGHGFF